MNTRIASFTRRQATNIIAMLSNPEEIEKFSVHPNKQVRKYVAHKCAKLRSAQVTAVTAVPIEEERPAVPLSEFDQLVARFTAEGKKNPVASARASMAARKQAEQRRAAA